MSSLYILDKVFCKRYLPEIFCTPSLYCLLVLLTLFLQKYSSLTKIVLLFIVYLIHTINKIQTTVLLSTIFPVHNMVLGILDDKYLLITDWITTVNILVCFILNENGIKLIYVLPSSYLKLSLILSFIFKIKDNSHL